MIACTSCRFHDDGYGNNCSHHAVMKPDPVYGYVMETCHNARSESGKCGVDAKCFEPSRVARLRDWWGCSLSKGK